MGRVAGVLDDPPGFPYTPPGIDVLEGGKLTSNNVAGSSHDPLQSTRPFAERRVLSELATRLPCSAPSWSNFDDWVCGKCNGSTLGFT